MNKELIITTYRDLQSIRAVSRELKISEQKVRKVLIDAGEYKSATVDEIEKLLAEGKTINEIADMLKITTKTINANIPYSRKPYKMNDRSQNAINIEKHRQNKNTQFN